MPHNVRTLIPNVTIAVVGAPALTIPNANTTVTLDDVSFSAIPSSAFASSTTVPVESTSGPTGQPYSGLYYSNTGTRSAYLSDLGSTTGAVSTQASFVAQDAALGSAVPAALTSSQNATAAAVDLPTSEALANALKTNYNQLQVDVAALRANDVLMQADIANLRTVMNAELTALQTAGGPQKSS